MNEVANLTEAEAIKQYLALVKSIALRFRPTTVSDFDDFLQSGYIGLLKAYRNYDPEFNVKFITFATTCIQREVYREASKFSRYGEILNDIASETYEELWQAEPDYLTEIEKDILDMRLQGYKFIQIGKKYGYTKAWASKMLQDIFNKIRKANIA